MAQRNSPSRRIPGQPLAGILRTVAYQARYSNRRRSNVATVTNRAATAESAAVAAAASSVAVLSGPATPSVAAVAAGAQPLTMAATGVAAENVAVEQPLQVSAVLMVGGDGRATWRYEDRGTAPAVVATVDADQPAVATVSGRTATSVTVHVWDLSGQPVPGATACITACWP